MQDNSNQDVALTSVTPLLCDATVIQDNLSMESVCVRACVCVCVFVCAWKVCVCVCASVCTCVCDLCLCACVSVNIHRESHMLVR